MFASLIQLACIVLIVVSLWKIFEKFGEKGWAAVIPFYNLYVLIRIVGWKPVKFWFFFIPIYNIYLAYLLYKDLAAKFDCGTPAYAIGLLLLPFVFLPLLAFRSESVNR